MSALPAELDAALVAFAARRPLLVASDYDGVLARLRGRPVGGGARARGRRGAGPAGRRRRRDGRAGQRPRAWPTCRRRAAAPGPSAGWAATARSSTVRSPASWPTGATRWPSCWRPLVAGVPGARLEVKPASVAVHVRQVAGPRRRPPRCWSGRATLVDSSLTLKPGKDVLEIAVTDADKGTALRRLRRRARRRRGACTSGDDVTDEDGFRALGAGRRHGQDRRRRHRRPLPGRRHRRRARACCAGWATCSPDACVRRVSAGRPE